jgi:hypothetical protein
LFLVSGVPLVNEIVSAATAEKGMLPQQVGCDARKLGVLGTV